jgi:hypothetical protein
VELRDQLLQIPDDLIHTSKSDHKITIGILSLSDIKSGDIQQILTAAKRDEFDVWRVHGFLAVRKIFTAS